MKKLLFVLMILGGKSWAQDEDILDKSIVKFSFDVNSHFGDFKKKMQTSLDGGTSTGFSLAYLRNPNYNSNSIGQLYIGLGMGFANNRQTEFKEALKADEFYMTHNEFFTHVLLRFKPIVYTKKIMPFVEVFAGPKNYFEKFFEVTGDQTASNLRGHSSWTTEYGFSGGFGYQISKRSRPVYYLEFGAGYKQNNPLKLLNKEVVGLDYVKDPFGSEIAVKPQLLSFSMSLAKYL